MELHVRNPHGTFPTPVKEYAENRLQKLERFFHEIGDVELVHGELRGRHTVSLRFQTHGLYVRGRGEASELRNAIDEAVTHVEGRLKRFRSKLQRKHGAKPTIEDSTTEPEVQEKSGEVTTIKTYSMRPMSPEDALMQMELQSRGFYIFNNEESGKICCLHLLNDGNYELLVPAA